MLDLTGRLTHFTNPRAERTRAYSSVQRDVISVASAQEAIRDIKSWPGYSETPLHSFHCLAEDTDLARIWYKDESCRFGLKSFKALGGPMLWRGSCRRSLNAKLACVRKW